MMPANAFAAPSTPTKSSSLDDSTARRTTDKCPPPPARPSTSTDNFFLHSMMMLNTDDHHQNLAIPALHLNLQEFHHILPSPPPPTIMRIKLKPRFHLKPKHTQHCSSGRPMKVCRTVKHATNTAFKKKTMVQKSMSSYQVVGRSNNDMMQVGRCRSASFGSPAA